MYLGYISVLLFTIIAFALCCILMILPQYLAPKKPDPQKNSQYECGFDPFSSARGGFNVHFYLVGVLFLLFDVEIIFLLPWAVNLRELGMNGFCVAMFFLFILTVGFIYELKKKVLEWH